MTQASLDLLRRNAVSENALRLACGLDGVGAPSVLVKPSPGTSTGGAKLDNVPQAKALSKQQLAGYFDSAGPTACTSTEKKSAPAPFVSCEQACQCLRDGAKGRPTYDKAMQLLKEQFGGEFPKDYVKVLVTYAYGEYGEMLNPEAQRLADAIVNTLKARNAPAPARVLWQDLRPQFAALTANEWESVHKTAMQRLLARGAVVKDRNGDLAPGTPKMRKVPDIQRVIEAYGKWQQAHPGGAAAPEASALQKLTEQSNKSTAEIAHLLLKVVYGLHRDVPDEPSSSTPAAKRQTAAGKMEAATTMEAQPSMGWPDAEAFVRDLPAGTLVNRELFSKNVHGFNSLAIEALVKAGLLVALPGSMRPVYRTSGGPQVLSENTLAGIETGRGVHAPSASVSGIRSAAAQIASIMRRDHKPRLQPLDELDHPELSFHLARIKSELRALHSSDREQFDAISTYLGESLGLTAQALLADLHLPNADLLVRHKSELEAQTAKRSAAEVESGDASLDGPPAKRPKSTGEIRFSRDVEKLNQWLTDRHPELAGCTFKVVKRHNVTVATLDTPHAHPSYAPGEDRAQRNISYLAELLIGLVNSGVGKGKPSTPELQIQAAYSGAPASGGDAGYTDISLSANDAAANKQLIEILGLPLPPPVVTDVDGRLVGSWPGIDLVDRIQGLARNLWNGDGASLSSERRRHLAKLLGPDNSLLTQCAPQVRVHVPMKPGKHGEQVLHDIATALALRPAMAPQGTKLPCVVCSAVLRPNYDQIADTTGIYPSSGLRPEHYEQIAQMLQDGVRFGFAADPGNPSKHSRRRSTSTETRGFDPS